MDYLTSLLPLVLILLVFYFLIIRPNNKKEKAVTAMRNSLHEGDEITTIGGIVGTVIKIVDNDLIVIETGASKNKLTIQRWAVRSCDVPAEVPAAKPEQPAEEISEPEEKGE